ncbi:MAG: penicillin-binding protein activator [Thalassotalea sp.]
MQISVFFRKNFQRLTTCLFILVVASCASPTPSSTKKASNQQNQTPQVEHKIAAEQLIAQAKKQPLAQSNVLLIKASKQYLAEERPAKALWLSAHLLTLEQTTQAQYQLNLIAATASQQLAENALALSYIENCQQLATKNAIKHSLDYYRLQHLLAEINEQLVIALNASLHIFQLSSESTTDDAETIWQSLSDFSQWQQTQLKQLNPPHVDGWLALAQTTNKYGGSNTFTSQIKVWQRKYPTHPANSVLANLLNSHNLQKDNYQKIAVILPLSGPQAIAGNSAQQGVLAAYQNDEAVSLLFIDSNDLDFLTLVETLQVNEIDFIIGPLIKDNVDKFLALKDILIPTLLLNVPEGISLQAHQFALSMRPEDEAVQAATLLSQRNFKHPVVMSHQDSFSQRIANAFAETWQKLTGEMPIVVFFEQGQKMQNILKNTLAIDESEARIKALKYRIRESIKVEPRNRRDIDMIYIVGNPRQTRLMKPYIDVNTSPFAKLIPVFASSRSHSVNIDQSTVNDLRGLTFTQIPLLLKSKQQNKALARTSEMLWPKRSDNLQRIFAMGFDSYAISNMLKSMKLTPYIRHYGQTGTLKLGKDNILTRSLLWGAYQRKKVTEIEME